MLMILRYPDGKRVEALLLSCEHERMRVMARGWKDTIEITLIRDRWVDDDGHKLSIEAIVQDAQAAGFHTNTKYRAAATATNTAAPAMRSRTAGRTS